MPTTSQIARDLFFGSLDSYRAALRSGNAAAIVASSVAVHAAKGGVPKRLHVLVGRAFRSKGSS